MKTVNIHEAKTQLSRLIAAAQAGEPFIIAKAGKPLVKVEALKQQPTGTSRLGFLGDMRVPDDLDRMGDDDIAGMFET